MCTDIDTTESGLSEKNVDESVTVNECYDEQSFSRDIGTITEPNEALPSSRTPLDGCFYSFNLTIQYY